MTTTSLEVCNRALQMCAARATIASLEDGSNEANNCNLLYNAIRDQVLGMANWNFARSATRLDLLKALPGTPQSSITTATEWVSTFPDPPWLFSYRYPGNCIRFIYLTSQPGVNISSGTPIFSNQQQTFSSAIGVYPQKFTISRSLVYPISNITSVTKALPAVVGSTGHGFATGNQIEITSIAGMTEINYRRYTITVIDANSYSLNGIDSRTYNTYSEGGIGINRSGSAAERIVINSNAVVPIGVYTTQLTTLSLWNETAKQALITALAGFLAIPLSGDKNLAKMLIEQANDHILTARAADGNEGMTIQEHMPDWLAARSGYGSSNYDSGILTSPYPPLFAVN